MKKIISCLVFLITSILINAPVIAQTGSIPAYSRTLRGYENPRGIIITQPPDGTVTQSRQVSILGACDYEAPLYMNGVEVSVTEHGFFALYVSLKDGENKFTFKNSGKEKTITIIKSDTEEILYSVPIYGVINRNYVTHRAHPDESVDLLTPLAEGTSFKIIGEAEDYYKIEGGTYVYKVAVDILDKELPQNIISGTTVSDEGSFTYIKLAMNVNALYDLSVSENNAKLSVYAGVDKSGIPGMKGSRFTDISKKFAEGKAEYAFTFNEKPLGHYVEFKNGELVTAFKFAGKTVSGSLNGKVIVLDAGHGGEDPGALGPLCEKGPSEKDFNLYVTLAAAEYLKLRGANVLLTRENDTFVELGGRVSFILEKKPDISVSVHSNSRPISQDYYGADGPLMYYTFGMSREAAESVLKYVAEDLGMKYIQPFKDNFALTRITNCPAILYEMSFVSNPDDYEWLLKPENLERMGRALGKGIEKYLISSK